VQILKPAGGAAPLPDQFVLPEISDPSKWLDNHLWWVDAKEPLTTLNYQGNVQLMVVYNKNLVKDPSEIKSYNDLLDPKWKGKLVSTDLRNSVVGGVSSRFIYQTPGLGAQYFDKLFGDQQLTLSVDQVQMVDWLAQGQFALGLFISPQNVTTAIDQGLPLGYVPGEQFKEGAVLGPSVGAVTVFDQAPHPAATRLMVNWLLSKDGQTTWQREVTGPSLRIDVPRDGVYPLFVPKPGNKYVDGGAEEFGVFADSVIKDTIDKALQRAKQ
jgi:iron(III) transport system substrate-binding protein